MPLSSRITPQVCFARLWKLLSAPEPELWREYRAATRGPKRQREALELLASVVWHLEMANTLAPWPTQKMEEFYSELLCRQPDALTPWKIWVDHYNEAKVTRSAARILIDYSLRERADVGVYAVQNTLIADAAMRLDSIREVLRPISNEKSLVLLKRPGLQVRLQSDSVPRIVNATAIVVALARCLSIDTHGPRNLYPIRFPACEYREHFLFGMNAPDCQLAGIGHSNSGGGSRYCAIAGHAAVSISVASPTYRRRSACALRWELRNRYANDTRTLQLNKFSDRTCFDRPFPDGGA